MKAKFFTIAIISTAAAGATLLSTADPAMAQGARFAFEPNVYGTEKFKRRHAYVGPQHAVHRGAVPSNMLGIDPTFVAKAPPPAPIPQVLPVMTAATPRILPSQLPRVTGQFQESFGKPAQPKALVANQAPAMSVPKQLSAPPAQQASKSVAARLGPRTHHNATRSVNAKLARRPAPSAASATPKIASYGNNKFYSPGGHTPASTGSGSRTDASVYGKVLHH